MIEKIYTGILLRSPLPTKSTVTVLDHELGKIQAVCSLKKHQPLMNASLLWYIRKPWRDVHTITFYELIAIPEKWVLSDIYFMHHILELGLFFLPEHKNVEQLFQLLLLLYEPCIYQKKSLYKKVFIYRFFSLLGIYPEYLDSYDASFINLISRPDDIMLNVHDDEYLHNQLNLWISDCLNRHPQKKHFKTHNFLKYMD